MAQIIYLLLSIVCVYNLSQAWNARQFSLHNGFVLGGLYFFLIPALLTVFMGPIEAEGLPIPPFSGERLDISVFVALCMLPLIGFAFAKKPQQIESDANIGQFYFYFCLSILITVIVFFLSGKNDGKHWADSSTTDGLIPNLLSVMLLTLRTYIFSLGSLVLEKNKKILPYLIIYALVDIFLTGNRISALYLAVAILASRAYRLKKMALPLLILSVPTIAFLSMYPAFRGVLWSEFGGFSGIIDAASYVYNNFDFSTLDSHFIWYFFEAANISVFQHLFDTYGHATQLLDGATVLIKPLTLFVPREIWPEKPEGLGIRLGPEIAGEDGLSLNSLLVGEFWANFGWMAPIAIASIMLLLYVLSQRIKLLKRNDLTRFVFLLSFASWRHEFNYFIFSTISGCALIYMLHPISSYFNRQTRQK